VAQPGGKINTFFVTNVKEVLFLILFLEVNATLRQLNMTKDNEPLCPIVFYKYWDKIISVGWLNQFH